jgi:uncharacterized protein
MAKAVLDSSVLISAFLTPQGAPGRILDAAERGVFVVCLSPEILTETHHVLVREPKLRARYGYGEEQVEAFCDGLVAVAELVSGLPELAGAVPLDPKDDVIVATAVAAGADYLVTGDRRQLLALGQYQEPRPRASNFARVYRQSHTLRRSPTGSATGLSRGRWITSSESRDPARCPEQRVQ